MIQTRSDPALADTNRDLPLQSRTVTSDINCDGCGYNLRSLALDARCPECNALVTHSLVRTEHGGPASRSERRWAVQVILGLIGMLVIYPQILWVELFMSFRETTFGNAPRINVIGPKLWAMSFVQRSIGHGVESLGSQGTWLALMNVSAVWLITARRSRSESQTSRANLLRLLTRWMCAMLAGGFFGFILNAEGTYYTDVALSKYAMIGVAGVELPGTLLLLLYLTHVAGTLDNRGLRRRLIVALAGVFIAQSAAIAMYTGAPDLNLQRGDLSVQIISSVYQGFCVVIGLFTAGCMLELTFCIAARIMPRRWSAWAH